MNTNGPPGIGAGAIRNPTTFDGLSSPLLTMHVRGGDEGGREPGTATGFILLHPDLAVKCQKIKRRGGPIANEPRIVEFPGVKFVLRVIADPDDNEIVISNRTD